MGMSERRKALRAKRAAQKEARMKSPGNDSVYARKQRSIYPQNSPYLTGDWGRPVRIDNFFNPDPLHREAADGRS